MNIKTSLFAAIALLALSAAPAAVLADGPVATPAVSTLGVSGYDLVSYHNAKRPLRGNGHFVATHEGVSYLFVNAENLAAFEAQPEKYLPAYGGYCAFGVSVGKKFVGDPEVWRVVDGTLYLNLDSNVQKDWLKDVPGRIRQADEHWQRIEDRDPASL